MPQPNYEVEVKRVHPDAYTSNNGSDVFYIWIEDNPDPIGRSTTTESKAWESAYNKLKEHIVSQKINKKTMLTAAMDNLVNSPDIFTHLDNNQIALVREYLRLFVKGERMQIEEAYVKGAQEWMGDNNLNESMAKDYYNNNFKTSTK